MKEVKITGKFKNPGDLQEIKLTKRYTRICFIEKKNVGNSKSIRLNKNKISINNLYKDTIRLIAKLSPLTSINLRWSSKEQINVGKLQIPNDLPAGNYTLSVIAEDGAYNQSSQEINLVILPRQ